MASLSTIRGVVAIIILLRCRASACRCSNLVLLPKFLIL
ncbi:hypothetical protein BVRB_5g103560 [Beta vulgaris subsp. vulgaris]|nr:hypothetical protein BVRB_5g103560 [Beta vulgaris subsp. vulgaris]